MAEPPPGAARCSRALPAPWPPLLRTACLSRSAAAIIYSLKDCGAYIKSRAVRRAASECAAIGVARKQAFCGLQTRLNKHRLAQLCNAVASAQSIASHPDGAACMGFSAGVFQATGCPIGVRQSLCTFRHIRRAAPAEFGSVAKWQPFHGRPSRPISLQADRRPYAPLPHVGSFPVGSAGTPPPLPHCRRPPSLQTC